MKVVVFNNGTLGVVQLETKGAGFLGTAVALDNPDLAAMARAAGLHAARVEDPGELRDAVRAMLAHDGPALLGVVTARQELAMPPKIEAGQVVGFGPWAPRAVLDGRTREVIDLARTNLLR